MLQYNERWSKVTNHEISYTTEELAKLLKVSKLTVYDLIKKRGNSGIPSWPPNAGRCE